jgi:hypothetical protein
MSETRGSLSAGARARERPALLAGAAILGLAAVVFAGPLFAGRVLFERDIHANFWGQSAAFARAVRGGAWPFWNPWMGFGQPMWANPGAQVLYPFTWLNLVVRPEDYYTLYAFGHLALAGLGMLALGRALRIGWGGALAGAAVYMLCGPLLSSVNLWQHFAGAAWMPLVVAAAVRALERPAAGRVLAWSLVQSLQVLSGSADLVALTALPQAGVFVHRIALGERALRASRLFATAAAATFTVGLTAAQWLPAVYLLRSSMRAQQSEESRTQWSLPPVLAAQAFVPLFPQDLPLRNDLRRRLYDSREPLLASLYLGLPALALALAAGSSTRRRLTLAGAALVLLSLWLALGRNGFAWFWVVSAFPPLALFRYPVKALLLGALGFALLCALGFEAWKAARLSGAAAARLGGAVAVAAGSALFAAAWLRADGLSYLSPSPEAPLDLAAAGSALTTVVWSGCLALVSAGLAVLCGLRGGGPRCAAAVAGLAVLDLLAAHHGLNKLVPAAVVRATPEAVNVLRADGAQRVYAFDYLVRPAGSPPLLDAVDPALARMPASLRHLALAQQYPTSAPRWGFRGSLEGDVVGLDSPERRGLRLLSIALQRDPAGLLRLLQTSAVTHVVARHSQGLEMLEPLSVVQTPSAGEVRVLRVPGSLPRAFVATRARAADGLEAYQALLDPAFEPRSTVLLPSVDAHAAAGVAAAWRVEIRDERADRLAASVTTDAPGLLVVTEGFDAGWSASVDGRPAPVLRANVVFRGVAVPAGTHDVRLSYRPPGLPGGLAVTALSLAGAIGLLARARRRPAGAEPPRAA